MPRLIINADDCGLSPANNNTVIDLHRRGYLSAASVMTNYATHREALAQFKACPDLDIGVHLNLTDGAPVFAEQGHHPGLMNNEGGFRGKVSLYMRTHVWGGMTLDWVRNELAAQMQRAVDAGIRLGHVSTHHHFHALAPLRNIAHELAADFGVDWVRGHDFFAVISPRSPMLRRQKQGDSPFAMPDYMTAIQANMSNDLDEYCAKIAALDGTIEIVVHPAPAHDPAFPADIGYGVSERHAETQRLIQVVDRLRALGLTLD